MAFENTIGAILGYNNALKSSQLIDEGHLTYVLQTMFVDIQSAITDGASSLPTGGTTGQVLAKASNTDADVEWVDASTGGDFLPLAGGTLEGIVEYDNDYSSSYADRSLVDKEYVDLAIQAAIDALP